MVITIENIVSNSSKKPTFALHSALVSSSTVNFFLTPLLFLIIQQLYFLIVFLNRFNLRISDLICCN